MSSIYHQADLKGCEIAYNIINQYPNYITSWTHTPGDTDGYDIQMTCTYPDGLVREEEAECKNREEPLYTLEYMKKNGVMYEMDKLNKQFQRLYQGIPQHFINSTYDGYVIWYYVDTLPIQEIIKCYKEALATKQNNKWCFWSWQRPKTYQPTCEKKRILKVILPFPDDNNRYGTVIGYDE